MTKEKLDELSRRRMRFIERMNEKHEVGHNRYGSSWTETDPDYLIRRMEEELYEYRQAIEHDRDVDAALAELADIVNFGLMHSVQSKEETDD